MPAWNFAQKLGIPILLIAASFAFCFLVLELGLRAVGFDPMAKLVRGRELILRESDNPLRIFELTPNTSGSAWRTQVEINSYGMRDREYPVERTAAPRIVVLGDSVTFGSRVTSEERFTDQLELLLSQRRGGPVEVLNLGVGGYDTLQEVATLEDVGLRFAPDLVVLAYCVNDIIDNSPNLRYIRRLRNLGSGFYRLRSVQLMRTALDRLRLTRQLVTENQEERFAERFGSLIAPVSDDRELMAYREELMALLERSDGPDFPLKWYASNPHLGKVRHALGRLQDLSRQHGLEVIVAIVPFLGESESYDVVYRMVEHMSLQSGFEVLVLEHSLSAAGLESLRVSESDPIHPSERGHRLIAEALAPRVSAALGEPRGHRAPDTPSPAQL